MSFVFVIIIALLSVMQSLKERQTWWGISKEARQTQHKKEWRFNVKSLLKRYVKVNTDNNNLFDYVMNRVIQRPEKEQLRFSWKKRSFSSYGFGIKVQKGTNCVLTLLSTTKLDNHHDNCCAVSKWVLQGNKSRVKTSDSHFVDSHLSLLFHFQRPLTTTMGASRQTTRRHITSSGDPSHKDDSDLFLSHHQSLPDSPHLFISIHLIPFSHQRQENEFSDREVKAKRRDKLSSQKWVSEEKKNHDGNAGKLFWSLGLLPSFQRIFFCLPLPSKVKDRDDGPDTHTLPGTDLQNVSFGWFLSFSPTFIMITHSLTFACNLSFKKECHFFLSSSLPFHSSSLFSKRDSWLPVSNLNNSYTFASPSHLLLSRLHPNDSKC